MEVTKLFTSHKLNQTLTKGHQSDITFSTYTLENIDRIVGCFPELRVTLLLPGDSVWRGKSVINKNTKHSTSSTQCRAMQLTLGLRVCFTATATPSLWGAGRLYGISFLQSIHGSFVLAILLVRSIFREAV